MIKIELMDFQNIFKTVVNKPYRLYVTWSDDEPIEAAHMSIFKNWLTDKSYRTMDGYQHIFENGKWCLQKYINVDHKEYEQSIESQATLHNIMAQKINSDVGYYTIERAFFPDGLNSTTRQSYLDKMTLWCYKQAGSKVLPFEIFSPQRRLLRGDPFQPSINISYICVPVMLMDKNQQLMFKLTWRTKLGINQLENESHVVAQS